MQTSKLSRRIGALEKELRRAPAQSYLTRKLSLSRSGPDAAFRHLCCAFDCRSRGAARDAINQTLSAPRGLVRLQLHPTGLLQGGVADILARYLAAYPEVQVALRGDQLDESTSSMRASISRFVLPGHPARRLRLSDALIRSVRTMSAECGSPALRQPTWRAERYSQTASRSYSTRSRRGHSEESAGGILSMLNQDRSELVHNPRLSANDFYSVRSRSPSRTGCSAPARIARPERRLCRSGALVRLLPLLSSQSGVVHAVFPSRRGMVPAVRLLLDTLSEGFAANPWFVGDCSNKNTGVTP